MNVRTVKPDDVIECNRLGRKFWARVEKHLGRALEVTPLTYNITYYTVTSREVVGHYPRRSRRDGKPVTREIPPGAMVTFEREGRTVIARVDARQRERLQVTPLHRAGQPSEQISTAQITGHYAQRQARALRSTRRTAAQVGGNR